MEIWNVKNHGCGTFKQNLNFCWLWAITNIKNDVHTSMSSVTWSVITLNVSSDWLLVVFMVQYVVTISLEIFTVHWYTVKQTKCDDNNRVYLYCGMSLIAVCSVSLPNYFIGILWKSNCISTLKCTLCQHISGKIKRWQLKISCKHNWISHF